ncbi:hypothetical protein [Inquilinus sp. OTU3971]|uniref:hypothetical protein n=1 Tax=Inquilinus sp. OTU3971 TaxID=3043855 RepID=UPI00406CB13E
MIIHSRRALFPGLARQFFESLLALKREIWLTSTGQIDFYDDPDLIADAVAQVALFFRGDCLGLRSELDLLAGDQARGLRRADQAVRHAEARKR